MQRSTGFVELSQELTSAADKAELPEEYRPLAWQEVRMQIARGETPNPVRAVHTVTRAFAPPKD